MNPIYAVNSGCMYRMVAKLPFSMLQSYRDGVVIPYMVLCVHLHIHFLFVQKDTVCGSIFQKLRQ